MFQFSRDTMWNAIISPENSVALYVHSQVSTQKLNYCLISLRGESLLLDQPEV